MVWIRSITISLLVIFIYLSKVDAQVTSSFNFSKASQSVSGWINVAGDPSVAVRTGTDPSSGISISSAATGNWSPFGGGGCAFDGGGASGGTFFPAGVMVNHWYQYDAYYGLYNASIPQLILGGLNIDSVYTIKITGSFIATGGFDPNPTRYTVTGSIIYGYVDVDADANTANGAIFHNIAPDPTGKIKIYVNTYNGSNVASICGLQIIQQRTAMPTPVVSITSPRNNTILPEDGNFAISATASETGGSVNRVEFYADSTLIGVDSTAPYSVTWVNPDEGNYTLKARAIDGVGNTSVSTINVSVQPLNTFWSLTGNIATNADSFFVGTVDTNRLAFRTNDIERVSILKDGTVGIGTKNTQGYQLAVNGSAIFTKVRIRNYASWPDYVFSKQYKLPGLDSLDSYIRAHRHLPGVMEAPTAEKEGLDMADGQAMLLKKVEELTLYLIREHKEVEKLKKEVQHLKKQQHIKPQQ